MHTRRAVSNWLVASFLGILLIPGVAASCVTAGPIAFMTKVVASTGGMCGLNQYLCGGQVVERVAITAASSGAMCRGEGLFRAPVDFHGLLSCSSMPLAPGVCSAPRLVVSVIAALAVFAFVATRVVRTAPIRAGPTPFVSSRRQRLSYFMPRGEPLA